MPAALAPLAPGTLIVKINENLPSSDQRRRSRSPQPYHRRKADSPNTAQANGRNVPLNSSSNTTPVVYDGTAFFDADKRKRRKMSTSPSDSGTEADDESGGLLRGLPAPPARPRKGLKEAGLGEIGHIPSPLLTPSYLDEGPQKGSLQYPRKRQESARNQPGTDVEIQHLRFKLARKRRAEILRRIVETALVGLLGLVIITNDKVHIATRHWDRGRTPVQGVNQGRADTCVFFLELLSHFLIMGALLVLYPVRLFFHTRSWTSNDTRAYRNRFWIPAAYDPAPLLYPVLLPVFIALSLMPVGQHVLIPNLVLSICCIPLRLIPFLDRVPGYGSMHWMLSLIPLAVSENSGVRGALHSIPYTLKISDPISLTPEIVTLLYPLHQALLPSLGYLTTTSLLPAELQLLSVAMINVLILSVSPQALILKALVWIGGLSLFILCGNVLRWSVALARVPSWRFRRASPDYSPRNVALRALDDYLAGRLRRWPIVGGKSPTSDSDELEYLTLRKSSTNESQKLRVETRNSDENPALLTALPLPAIDGNIDHNSFARHKVPSPPQVHFRRQRRHTLPSYGVSPGSSPRQRTSDLQRNKSRLGLVKPKSFLTLTRAQASILKWIYAFYVYVVVTAVIAVGIRTYVRRRALHGHEPVGWALGYLFGDISSFRIWVASSNLERWISLPPWNADSRYSRIHCRPEHLPQIQVGEANTRLLICGYCLGIIAAGLGVVFRLSAVVEVDTRRKVFHGMMVAMFLPVTFIDPTFAALALSLILSIFLLLDLFRASQLPPLSKPLTHFLAPYVDGRDHRGPVIVSHIFLLIGCAIPLWLSLARTERCGTTPWEGWKVKTRDLSMVSGVICVGMGDAAASLIGRRYGRRRWMWSGGKSLEGSLAFAIAVMLGLLLARIWLRFGGWEGDSEDAWALTCGKAALAAAGASLTEAVLTGGNDNVVVPVILWLLVRGLEM